MLSSLNIPKKLAIAFVAINLSAAVMMLVFATNIMMISRSTERTNFHQSIHAKAMSLETQILRQNSQVRGYLVTGDDLYLKSYYDGRDIYDATSAELEKELADPALRNLLLESRAETLKWRADWGDKSIEMVKDGQREAAADRVRDAGKAALVSDAVLPLRDLRDQEQAQITAESEGQETSIATAWIALVVGGLALCGLAVALQRKLSRDIASPVGDLTETMTTLASGCNDVDVPGTDRVDELGNMARAVLVFRDQALAKITADHDREAAMAEIGRKLHDLSQSDLRARLHDLPDAFASVSRDFNNALDQLCAVMVSVRGSIDSISTGSSEIRQAASDLSNRSEEQAAKLQSSAAAMDEITRKVGESAGIVSEANRAMSDARGEAEQGGAVVRRAIEAMNGIDQATREIAEIITVIDGIAFQTNLLALNAGVEAARAGDAGKGFAVVASEVRALAQRAADAAADVKSRILSATEHVTSGVELVNDTGGSLNRIIERVSSVSESIEAMAETAEQQSSGLLKVNEAISAMDAMTQQNAAMVEETTAATEMLAREAQQLFEAFSTFKVDDSLPRTRTVSPSSIRPAAVQPAPRPAARPRLVGNLAVKTVEDDWSEF
ncbi:methyl-accepting chemotaxis protein [Novosphingobium mangrovi (ex Huang et al. 2023)]|uniref:Methyl-accepting chemotaxis protein n=1 Tax=Novosphingobium mangrovi (ex Huang et al. 2023) TaxID=2976432 RepID=A0ABT2I980_9SPHN|nr:methyl-accepting chemotaxis protein [Novosphingobium mangrovi (ex Huang et al. 2023)]MCT2401363.1 methyl-accepting chemotaxis protein [Novosphingobium mangrovi (ex Huang et al. 2023)]